MTFINTIVNIRAGWLSYLLVSLVRGSVWCAPSFQLDVVEMALRTTKLRNTHSYVEKNITHASDCNHVGVRYTVSYIPNVCILRPKISESDKHDSEIHTRAK